MSTNPDENQINEIVEMLDDFSNSRDKRVKIDTSDKLKAGEKQKSCYLSKYDKTDPFVKDIASIPKGSDKKLEPPGKDASFNFDFLKL